MGERTLNEQIEAVLEVAIKPLSAADIRRRLAGNVEAGEVSSRLSKMAKKGQAVAVEIASQAITGPRKIKGWVSPTNPLTLEYIPAIAKTPEKREISSGVVASNSCATTQAA